MLFFFIYLHANLTARNVEYINLTQNNQIIQLYYVKLTLEYVKNSTQKLIK